MNHTVTELFRKALNKWRVLGTENNLKQLYTKLGNCTGGNRYYNITSKQVILEIKLKINTNYTHFILHSTEIKSNKLKNCTT